MLLAASCTSVYALNTIWKQIFGLLCSLACLNVGRFRSMSLYCNLLSVVWSYYKLLMSQTFSIVRTNLSQYFLNPLNTELNPICPLLALLGGATIVVVSRLRVNLYEFVTLWPKFGILSCLVSLHHVLFVWHILTPISFCFWSRKFFLFCLYSSFWHFSQKKLCTLW